MTISPTVAGSLRRIPVRRIANVLEQAASRFLNGDSPVRRQAIDSVADQTGFSAPMVARAIDWTFSEIDANAMRRLLISELGHKDAADDPALRSPRLTLLIAAGAIFQPAVNGVVFSLLIKSPVFVKCSSHEQHLLPLFARTLRDIDADIGGAVETATGLTSRIQDADAVVAYGSDESVSAIRASARPDAAFIGHGHKVSLAVIGRDGSAAALDEAARNLAVDIAMYEQSGCLSPQNVFVEGADPAAFAARLANALSGVEPALPSGRRPLEQAAAIQSFRHEFEFRASQDDTVRCFFGDDLRYTVVTDPDPVFRPSPLGRTILVKPLERLARLPEALAPIAGHAQAVSASRVEDMSSIEGGLRGLGASYFCELGRMQRPPLSWANAGVPCLLSLLRP